MGGRERTEEQKPTGTNKILWKKRNVRKIRYRNSLAPTTFSVVEVFSEGIKNGVCVRITRIEYAGESHLVDSAINFLQQGLDHVVGIDRLRVNNIVGYAYEGVVGMQTLRFQAHIKYHPICKTRQQSIEDCILEYSNHG